MAKRHTLTRNDFDRIDANAGYDGNVTLSRDDFIKLYTAAKDLYDIMWENIDASDLVAAV